MALTRGGARAAHAGMQRKAALRPCQARHGSVSTPDSRHADPARFRLGRPRQRRSAGGPGPDGSDVSETDTDAGISGIVSCNGSTVTTCNSFDQGTRLGSATTSSNDQSYAADADSNSSALPELQGTTSQPAATYDGSDELISSTQSGTTTNYVYDGDGQLSSENQGSGNTVTSVPDSAGNIIAYNDTNTTADTGANMSSATYNGDGLMIAETSTPAGGSATTENFTYDSDDMLLEDSSYVFPYGPDGTVEQDALSNGQSTYLLSDDSGAVRGVVSGQTGFVMASTTYDALGNPQTAPIVLGGASYPGLTAYTPLVSGSTYVGATGLVSSGRDLSDPSTGAGMMSMSKPSNTTVMWMFWHANARGTGFWRSGTTGGKTWSCKAGPGTIFTGGAGTRQDGYVNKTPCTGFFYHEGDHGGERDERETSRQLRPASVTGRRSRRLLLGTGLSPCRWRPAPTGSSQSPKGVSSGASARRRHLKVVGRPA